MLVLHFPREIHQCARDVHGYIKIITPKPRLLISVGHRQADKPAGREPLTPVWKLRIMPILLLTVDAFKQRTQTPPETGQIPRTLQPGNLPRFGAVFALPRRGGYEGGKSPT